MQSCRSKILTPSPRAVGIVSSIGAGVPRPVPNLPPLVKRADHTSYDLVLSRNWSDQYTADAETRPVWGSGHRPNRLGNRVPGVARAISRPASLGVLGLEWCAEGGRVAVSSGALLKRPALSL
jgi:hypothetical protein